MQPTSSRNTRRHGQKRSSSSSGTVATMAPTAPAENVIAFIIGSRSGGYQST